MRIKFLAILIVLALLGIPSAYAATSFSVGFGNNDYYTSVGDYDYLPYYSNYPGRINFYDVLGNYGSWVTVSPFGQCWRPYVTSGWRPYTNGHWINTSQYGPMWEGYEPWAWAGYHYGNWVFTQRFGWVWIPGYDWHPGRVAWGYGQDTIGWSPAPPYGYDYSRGYLSYRGDFNQYSYYDDDFGYYGANSGPCYDPRYSSLYCNSAYNNVGVNLWVFIDQNRFGYPNYADYWLGPSYTRNLFQRRSFQVYSRPLRQELLRRVVKQRLDTVPVRVRELQTDRRKLRVVVPDGAEERIRRHAHRTVNSVIAPAFRERNRAFKGTKALHQESVSRVFHQENRQRTQETHKAHPNTRSADVQRRTYEAPKAHPVQRREVERSHQTQFKREPVRPQLPKSKHEPTHPQRIEVRREPVRPHQSEIRREPVRPPHQSQIRREPVRPPHQSQIQREPVRPHQSEIRREPVRPQRMEIQRQQHEQIRNYIQHRGTPKAKAQEQKNAKETTKSNKSKKPDRHRDRH